MTRVLSGLVLAAVFGGLIWIAPFRWLLVVAEFVLIIGVWEFAALLSRAAVRIPRTVAAAIGGTILAAVALPDVPVEVVLMAATLLVLVLALAMRPGPGMLPRLAATLLPGLYLGLPLGAMVVVHRIEGREALLLLVATVAASDVAQYSVGSIAGRRRLAPAISPNKTIEGLGGGIAGGVAVMLLVGPWWLPGRSWFAYLAVGSLVVVFGVAGDLVESFLKRSAGVKDSSSLIPGHGGGLDRLDALLFGCIPYYVYVRYIGS